MVAEIAEIYRYAMLYAPVARVAILCLAGGLMENDEVNDKGQ